MGSEERAELAAWLERRFRPGRGSLAGPFDWSILDGPPLAAEAATESPDPLEAESSP